MLNEPVQPVPRKIERTTEIEKNAPERTSFLGVSAS
jgi:hypothetical protein